MDKDGDSAVIGTPRSKQQTLAQIGEIRSKRTEKERSILKTRYGIKDSPNPLLELPMDLHKYNIWLF